MKECDARATADAFLRDMAEHQRVHRGQIPTPRQNEQLAKPLLEQLEREQSEAKPAIASPSSPDPSAAPKERRWQKRARERGWKVLPQASGNLAVIDPAQLDWWIHVRERVFLLLTKHETGPLGQPSWRSRIKAALMSYLWWRSKRPEAQNPGLGELLEVLEASSAVFGCWRKRPGAKLFSRPLAAGVR